MTAESTYIVRFSPDSTKEEIDETKSHLTDSGAEIVHEYTLIKAVAVRLPEAQVSALEALPSVEGIEKDQEVKAI
ncbi:uncharacterized protein V1516DRAFT_677331 [Lipomyces oligophaga]|uniref:uncharacterized protein n=1 Tax=Lipomyces oligophaga TaxID=45792 RepID=UPI0034CD5EE8